MTCNTSAYLGKMRRKVQATEYCGGTGLPNVMTTLKERKKEERTNRKTLITISA